MIKSPAENFGNIKKSRNIGTLSNIKNTLEHQGTSGNLKEHLGCQEMSENTRE